MTVVLWIGLGFLIALFIFLMIAFFHKDNVSRPQYAILKFLIALSAGFAGGFLAGEALFSLTGELSSGMSIAISGTSGVALFFSIWFYFPKYLPEPPPDTFNFSIPENWTFEQTINGIVDADNSVASIKGFSAEELKIIMRKREIHSKSALEALTMLEHLGTTTLPEFRVKKVNNIYSITKT